MIIIQILISYILFGAAIIFCFYLPGIYLLSFTKKPLTQFLAWPIGYSLFILLSYITAWLHSPFIALAVVCLMSIFVLCKRREYITFSWSNIDKVAFFIIILGSLAFTSMSFLSGLQTATGLQYVGTVNSSDGLMHIAHIKTQVYNFPPPHAGFAGYSMHGYHYFYDFLLSRFSLFFHFSADSLFFRLFPLFLSIIYGASFYFFSTLFTKKRSALYCILFFVYFAQSWGFVLSLFTKTVDITNGLGLVQPLELVLDPSAIFAIALMLCGFYLLLEGKITLQKALLASLILGVLAEMKVYGGIISIFTLGVLIVYRFVRRKPVGLYMLAFLCTSMLTAVTYLPNNIGVGSLFAKPFFLYETFIEQNHIFASWNWVIRMTIYAEHHNTPHILFMYLIAFLLFWVMTLGSRVFLFLSFSSLLKKEFWKEEKNICFVIFLIFPLFVGSIFVQSFSIFSTIQFLWIVGLLLAIPAGIFYGKLYDRSHKYGKVLLIIFLLFTNAGAFLANEKLYLLPKQPVVVTSAQLKVIHTIEQNVGVHDFFVVAPTRTYDIHNNKVFTYTLAPFFAAMSGRMTYYEYETPEYYDQKKIDQRRKQVENLTLYMEECDDIAVQSIMKEIHAKYFVTTEMLACNRLIHINRIIQEGSWTFWEVK